MYGTTRARPYSIVVQRQQQHYPAEKQGVTSAPKRTLSNQWESRQIWPMCSPSRKTWNFCGGQLGG
jgi:hypothetical protein